MSGVLQIHDWDLMSAPSSLHRLAVHELRPGPAFGRAEYDHRPARSLNCARRGTRRTLNFLNIGYGLIKRTGEALMHHGRDVAFHKMGFITVTADQVSQFSAADAREHGRVGDLKSIEMKDGENRAIARRIEKLVRMPARGERARLRLAVADDAGHDQIGIIECRAIRMEERIAEFAALMDRPRWFRRDMTRNAVWPGELTKQPLQPVSAALDIRIALGVRPLQVAMRHQSRTAMTGADDINHVEIVFFDQPVQVNVNEIDPGGGAPMPEQAGLDVFERERGFEQWIVLQIDLLQKNNFCVAFDC